MRVCQGDGSRYVTENRPPDTIPLVTDKGA